MQGTLLAVPMVSFAFHLELKNYDFQQNLLGRLLHFVKVLPLISVNIVTGFFAMNECAVTESSFSHKKNRKSSADKFCVIRLVQSVVTHCMNITSKSKSYSMSPFKMFWINL